MFLLALFVSTLLPLVVIFATLGNLSKLNCSRLSQKVDGQRSTVDGLASLFFCLSRNSQNTRSLFASLVRTLEPSVPTNTFYYYGHSSRVSLHLIIADTACRVLTSRADNQTVRQYKFYCGRSDRASLLKVSYRAFRRRKGHNLPENQQI